MSLRRSGLPTRRSGLDDPSFNFGGKLGDRFLCASLSSFFNPLLNFFRIFITLSSFCHGSPGGEYGIGPRRAIRW